MKKIGYIPLSIVSNKDYMSSLEYVNKNVKELNLELIGLKEISEFDALIIQDDENKFIEYICEILVYLKQHSKTLVWFVSERLSTINRTIYPRLGIDGLSDKESEPDELALLVSNGLSRMEKECQNSHNLKGFVFDKSSLSLRFADQNIHLTRLEFFLLELLYKNKNRAITYDEIYEHVWGNMVENKQYRVANLVFHLRKKIIGSKIDIKTVRSVGYLLTVD